MGEEEGSRRKRVGESRRTKRADADAHPLPDLSAFMNDRFFFGDTVNYPQPQSQDRDDEEEEEEEEETPKNKKSIYGTNNGASHSRRTQEWLEEARLIVSSSPARRLVDTRSSPSLSPGPSILNYNSRHERMSRSARHSNSSLQDASSQTPPPHILSMKSNRLSVSARLDSNPARLPASRFSTGKNATAGNSGSTASNSEKENDKKEAGVQRWFANILKKGGAEAKAELYISSVSENADARNPRPPRAQPRNNNNNNNNNNEEEAANYTVKDVLRSRRSTSVEEGKREGQRFVGLLSPPRRSVVHMHARPPSYISATPARSAKSEVEDVSCLNNFLKKQRNTVTRGSSGSGPTKLILSAPISSTSSMVAAICYARLLAETGEREAVPVINMKRTQMRGHTQRQAAWLFHHVGIDARSLLFADEVDMESLAHAGRLNIIVIGQDALNTNTHENDNDGVVSPCTCLIDKYYKQAYDLLEAPYLRKLLLAGVLVDTENLGGRVKRRDIQAIDLLLVDANPDHKNNFLLLLKQKHDEDEFEEVLQSNYGEPKTSGKSHAPPPSSSSSSSGKNIISQAFSKWFGFGSK